MSKRKFTSIVILLVGLVASIWLLTRPGRLAPETATRQQALRQALAPAGAVSGTGAGVEFASDYTYEPIEPVTVNLADVPAGEYAPYNTFDAWQQGLIDLDETEARVSRAELLALQEDALGMAPDPNVQIPPAGPLAPTATVTFDGLDASECCGGGTSVPPDSDMAAGPNHLIGVVNVSFEVYDKNGNTLVAPTTFASFFSAIPDCVASPYGAFDPTVVYDEEADRFAIGVDGNGTDFCMAVTTTNDPTGSWNLYNVTADIMGAFHDYPHIGVGQDAIYVGANQFGGTVPGGFEGRVWALDKWDMYNGNALTPQTASIGLEGTPQPLHLHGWLQGTWPSGGSYYFVSDPYDGDTLTLWEWNNALGGGSPSIATTFNLQTATGVTSGAPVNAPQLGGSDIQANDFRFRAFEYRNGYGWTTDSISCNPGGGTTDCVRWAQIDLTTPTPTLVQSGVYGTSGEYRTFPDITANHCNDVAVGYSKLSSSTYPAVWYTGRESGDPAGTLQAEAMLKAGETTYVSFDSVPYRWGDYSGMTIDPDGVTFWFMGEYSKNVPPGPAANWGNYIGAFTYPNCTPPIPYGATLGPDSTLSASPGVTATHTFTLANTGIFSDAYSLAVSGNTWTTTLQTGSPISITAGMSATISVDVGVPNMPTGTDTFTLTATSVNSPTLMATATGTTDILTAGIATSGDMMDMGAPSDTVTYTIAVTNTGAFSDSFAISLGGNTWTTTSTMTNTGTLTSGMSTTVDVFVTVGPGVLTDTATVTFTSTLDGSVMATVTLTTESTHPIPIYLPIIMKP